MNTVLKVGPQSFSPREVMQKMVDYQILSQLSREIIIDQAIADVECTDEQMDQAHQQFCAQYQLSSTADIQTWLQQNGMTSEQLQQAYLRPVKLENFKRNQWGLKVGNHFLKLKQNFDQVSYSLLRTQDPALAQELYFRIEEGEADFSDLARSYSQGAEVHTGGLIGPVELSEVHPQLAQLLHASQVGQLFPPMPLEEWHVIVRLEEFIPSVLDARTEQRLLDDLFHRWLQEQQQQVSLQQHESEEHPQPDLQVVPMAA